MCRYNSKQSDLILSTANGGNIYTYGCKTLTVDFGLDRTFTFSFVVASINQAIIGADFLYKFNLLLDLRGRKLVDRTTKIYCMGNHTDLNISIPKIDFLAGDFSNIFNEFPNLVSEPDFSRPVLHNVLHYIHTNGNLPCSRPRRLSTDKLKIARTEFQTMVDMGICRPSSSPTSSPLHMVPKKNSSSWRP